MNRVVRELINLGGKIVEESNEGITILLPVNEEVIKYIKEKSLQDIAIVLKDNKGYLDLDTFKDINQFIRYIEENREEIEGIGVFIPY